MKSEPEAEQYSSKFRHRVKQGKFQLVSYSALGYIMSFTCQQNLIYNVVKFIVTTIGSVVL